jgi:hypothetical protein
VTGRLFSGWERRRGRDRGANASGIPSPSRASRSHPGPGRGRQALATGVLLLLVALVGVGAILLARPDTPPAPVPERIYDLPPTRVARDIPATWDGKTTSCDVDLDWDGEFLTVTFVRCDPLDGTG